MNAKSDDDKSKKVEEPKVEKPVPSQNKADEIREEVAPAVTETAKLAKKNATDTAPYPSQADLDAIKEGTFRAGREAKADDGGAKYKTR